MMEKMYHYEYPRPAVTTDCVVLGVEEAALYVLLIDRGSEPCKGAWALPGGFLEMDESAEQCAARELKEETGIDCEHLEQLQVFSAVDRDPRGRVLTIAFLALVEKQSCKAVAGDDAAKLRWFRWDDLPRLAFDHAEIIRSAGRRLREKMRLDPSALQAFGEALVHCEVSCR